jgi:rhodanese-related sulfurtransferase
MASTNEILSNARQRGQDAGLPYAGAVTPKEAYELLRQAPRALLVDVRTNAERDWVGRVQVPDQQHEWVQWNLYPDSVRNPDFLDQLSAVATPDRPLLFLCRSGVRSRHAATLAAQHGFANSFDILEGFEGDKDQQGHRKVVNGWCHAGLPWVGA